MALRSYSLLLVSAVALAVVNAVPPRVFLNVIIDDLGWANIGPRSPNLPENAVPRITSLIARGVLLNRQYNHFTCTPSRSAFTTGRLPVHVQTTLANPDVLTAGVPVNMTALPLKMRAAGFTTAVYGKWDMGFASLTHHTPEGRGYDHSFVYAEHMNNYFSQQIEPTGVSCTNRSLYDLWENGAPAVGVAGTGRYFDDLVLDRALSMIANFSQQHGNASGGLFLDVRPHSMHWPLMVDEPSFVAHSWVQNDEPHCGMRFYGDGMWPGGGDNATAFSCRRQFQAMLANLDDRIGRIEDALVAAGLWDSTLMTFFSDNGGCVDILENAANNHPLAGGKYGPMEGGIRVSSFVSGGFLPVATQGTQIHGLFSVADWYVTLCMLAGLNEDECRADPLASAAGLPPIDSLNVWPLITGLNLTSPRTELPVSDKVLLQYGGPGGGVGGPLWKLLIGRISMAGRTGPVFPNSTGANPADVTLACGNTGCLFDVWADASETYDVSDAHPEIVKRMTTRLAQLSQSFYSNSDSGGVDECPHTASDCMCWAAENTWGGFLGPWHHW